MSNKLHNEALHALDDVNTNHITTPLTLTDVVVKTATCLGVVIATAIPGWMFLSGNIMLYLGLLVALTIFGITMFRNAPVSPPKALTYSALLGLIVGAFTKAATLAGGSYDLIPQAILGTACGAIGMVLLYSTPFGRRASRAVKLFTGLFIGYFILSIISLITAFFGVGNGWGLFGVDTFGLLLCLAGVALATWSFLIDLGATDAAITAGAPHTWSWTFGVSITASLVWMYLEILRLLAISRQ